MGFYVHYFSFDVHYSADDIMWYKIVGNSVNYCNIPIELAMSSKDKNISDLCRGLTNLEVT
jgi:hypothetical protein